MENPNAIRCRLAHATGTGQYWRAFPENDKFLFTDGVKDMAEACDAFWLISAVFSYQFDRKVRSEPFQVWILQFNNKPQGDDALLICENGNNIELTRQEISYTDFPLPEGIKLYLDGGVLMLPSEY